MEPVSLVLQGGFLTTGLPGKPSREIFISTSLCFRAEPVLSRIQENRKRVILPSIDNIKQDTFEVQRYENSAHGYSWELWCMYISPPKDWWDAGDPSLPIRSVPSACAPEAFASPDPGPGREGERLGESERIKVPFTPPFHPFYSLPKVATVPHISLLAYIWQIIT